MSRSRSSDAGQRLVVWVSDDGQGGADPARGSGLRGLADRVEALGGRLSDLEPDRCRHHAGGRAAGRAGGVVNVLRPVRPLGGCCRARARRRDHGGDRSTRTRALVRRVTRAASWPRRCWPPSLLIAAAARDLACGRRLPGAPRRDGARLAGQRVEHAGRGSRPSPWASSCTPRGRRLLAAAALRGLDERRLDRPAAVLLAVAFGSGVGVLGARVRRRVRPGRARLLVPAPPTCCSSRTRPDSGTRSGRSASR